MDWLKKLAGYAPDIATAIATGGASLPATAIRILGRELLGNEAATQSEVAMAIQGASADQMVALTKANNEFKVEMARISAEDRQSAHGTTQETIRNGDNSQHWWVSATRPAMAWCGLAAAYLLADGDKSFELVGLFISLPFGYMGFRQLGKWKTASALASIAGAKR